MSEMAPEQPAGPCRHAGKNQPRIVPGRHNPDCPGDCAGCLECTHPHCRICNRTHTDGTCPECLAITRETLHQIARMCDALPEEVEHRGINGEAMMLLGPTADPEALGHMEASVRAGRVPPEYLELNDTEIHPAFVLLSWQMVWRDALDHAEPADTSLATAVDYLDTQMTYMGGYPHASIADFNRDLRRCRNHLEAVLHDGEQVDRGAPCMGCNATLERVWDYDDKGDGWRCPRCKQTSSDAQYRFAVMHLHREEAEWLTDRDMQLRTGVNAGTVRSWARAGTELVRKRRDAERTVYSVADVMATAKNKGLVA